MALPPQQFLQKKIFYLDVTENLHSKLESRIKQLGGKVNMAFDVHEITHVVTNRVVAGVKMLDPNTNQYISSIPPVEPPTTSVRPYFSHICSPVFSSKEENSNLQSHNQNQRTMTFSLLLLNIPSSSSIKKILLFGSPQKLINSVVMMVLSQLQPQA